MSPWRDPLVASALLAVQAAPALAAEQFRVQVERRGARVPMKARAIGLAAALAGAALAGCAALERPLDAHLASEVFGVRECAQWFETLDQAIDAARVRDVQDTRVEGFPYLRVNRLLASMRAQAMTSFEQRAYVERLRALDIEARGFEIANLPRALFDTLPDLYPEAERSVAVRRSAECGHLLARIDLDRPQALAKILARARVPDDYSTAHRVLGLYALTRVLFASGVRRWQGEVRERFRGALTEPTRMPLVRYAPVGGSTLYYQTVAGYLGRAVFEPFGILELSERELERVFAAYAPSFEIEVGGDFDRFGRLRWERESAVPTVDASALEVYTNVSHTRYGEHVLLQLVYTIWFPQRPPAYEGDILAGRLDGLTWRVTLAPDGEPLIYDAIHPCGCFHMFFPTARARPRPAPDSLEEWAFVPQTLPRVQPGERPRVRLASGTHYIERVSLVRGADSLVRYQIQPYNALRSMWDMRGGKRSAFGPRGLIAGSERPERFLFWPMGIESAGAMRQWGRHATAFVGRRHFDDADLFERRFELELDRPRR